MFAFGGVPDAVAEWLRGAGIETTELYGQTESGGLGVVNGAMSGNARLSAAGEIELAGAQLGLGYWRAPGQIEPFTNQGWRATGDIGRLEGNTIRKIIYVPDRLLNLVIG